MHLLQAAFGIIGADVAIAGVNGEAICGIAYHDHPTTGAVQPLDQPGRKAVVMIRAGGLDVSVVFVEAEIDKAGFGFVIPTGARIVIPKFSGAGIEGNAI